MTIAASTPLFSNVFVLCTGRSGSQTFVRACEHFTNYTAGHETLSRALGPARLDYPNGHIEADNRLAWFLGRLEQRYGDKAFYVHLKRAPEKVAESYDQRWDHRFSLISGYNRSILMQTDFNRDVARDMVDTITANIDVFLASKSNVIEIDIDAPEDGFHAFAARIGAQGDLSAAIAEFKVNHNQRKVPEQGSKARVILHPSEMVEKITELEKKNNALLVEEAAVAGKIAKLQDRNDTLLADKVAVVDRITLLQDRNTKLLADKVAVVEKITSFQDRITKLLAEKVTVSDKNTVLQDRNTKLLAEKAKIEEQIAKLQDHNSSLLADKFAAVEQITIFKKAELFLEARIKSISAKVVEMKQIIDLQNRNNILLERKAAAEADLRKLKSSLQQVSKKSKKQKQILLILALPSIVGLSPVLLLIYVLKKLRRYILARKKTISASSSAKIETLSGSSAEEMESIPVATPTKMETPLSSSSAEIETHSAFVSAEKEPILSSSSVENETLPALPSEEVEPSRATSSAEMETLPSSPSIKSKILSAFTSAKTETQVVVDAFDLRQEKGPQAAIELLRRDERMLAKGVVDLFAAMDADSDETWLPLINRWGGANQIPQISLTTDGATRFSRMQFATLPPVPSPDLVTVIIPCFNCQDSVTQSVESILGQTWTNLEIIAVNDASTDNTGAVLDALAVRDARLRVLHNVVNVGPYVSKNRALQQAQGRYVTGHDGDDISLPDRIEKQVQSLHANQGAVATISFMVRLDEEGRFDGPTKAVSRTYDGIARLCPISLICDTNVLREKLGGWDCVRFGGDSELIDRITLALGDTFVRDKQIVMLCLNSATGLTSDPVHGINTPTGLSPVRRDYVKSYRAWHGAVATHELHLPFPHVPRKFDAPMEMLVPAEGLRKLLDLP